MINRCCIGQNQDYFSELMRGIGKPSSSNSTTSRLSSSDPFKVSFGQRTFDAEGTEKPGIYFSRQIGWPPKGASGVTIGRGYDLGQRSAGLIIKELTAAGMPLADAQYLSKAAGLRKENAGRFVKNHLGTAPIMSPEVQRNLFEDVLAPKYVSDIKRIFSKPDVKKAYGEASWDNMPMPAKELVFDLMYRGDYSPTTRKVLQPLLVNEDYKGLAALMNNTAYWNARGVPSERMKERQAIARDLPTE